MSKTLLKEYINPNVIKSKIFMEDTEDAFGKKEKCLHMAGIFIQGGIRNANERVYPVHEIKNAVHTLRSQLANKLDILGEVDHPDDLKINLDRVSHNIVDMDMDGSNGIGKLKILPTPMGNIIKTMLEAGIRLGVSSRGSGNVDDSTGEVSDFEIITVDVVAQPSAPGAFPKPIYEGIGNQKYGHKVFDLAKEASGDLKVQRYLKEEVIRIIKGLNLR
jgi:hypothetical protein